MSQHGASVSGGLVPTGSAQRNPPKGGTKGASPIPSTPSINIAGEGNFDAMYEYFLTNGGIGIQVYPYDGTISARTTKAGALNLNIRFTSDNGIPFYPSGIEGITVSAPIDEKAYLTEVRISQLIPKGSYSIEQNPYDSDKKLVKTIISTDVYFTLTYQPVTVDPVTGEEKSSGQPITVLVPYAMPITVVDNGVFISVNDFVLLDGWIAFVASYDTLNQQK